MHPLTKAIASTPAMILLGGMVTACSPVTQGFGDSGIRLREEQLLDAGFKIMIADTQDRQNMLATLPPNTITSLPHGGETYYVYPDPEVCSCLYVGRQEEYQRLAQLAVDSRRSNQALAVHEMEEDQMSGWGLPAPWNYIQNPSTMGRPAWDPS